MSSYEIGFAGFWFSITRFFCDFGLSAVKIYAIFFAKYCR